MGRWGSIKRDVFGLLALCGISLPGGVINVFDQFRGFNILYHKILPFSYLRENLLKIGSIKAQSRYISLETNRNILLRNYLTLLFSRAKGFTYSFL